jgi:hypothetical protein
MTIHLHGLCAESTFCYLTGCISPAQLRLLLLTFRLCENTVVSCRVSLLRTYRWQYPGLVTRVSSSDWFITVTNRILAYFCRRDTSDMSLVCYNSANYSWKYLGRSVTYRGLRLPIRRITKLAGCLNTEDPTFRVMILPKTSRMR